MIVVNGGFVKQQPLIITNSKKGINLMKVFITKYALTKGVFEREIDDNRSTNTVVHGVGEYRYEVYFKPHWHVRKEDALDQCEIMRKKAIITCKKKLDKLEAMKFKI